MYEQPEERAKCDPVSSIYLGVQLGLAYNYTGDHPKAIALLNAALREATEHGGGAQVGSVYVALARVYRNINEYTIARDHAQKALEHFRGTGDWRGLAEANFGIALAEVSKATTNPRSNISGSRLKLVGDHPAPYLLGKIYTNMAASAGFSSARTTASIFRDGDQLLRTHRAQGQRRRRLQQSRHPPHPRRRWDARSRRSNAP
jgi:tetratricopeptide (TPR) repeat protein